MNLEQNTPEWLQWRRSKIGASDAAIIMGISPYSTPYKLWLEKVTGTTEYQNSAMRRGSQLEPIARGIIEGVTGKLYTPTIRIHKEYEWMIASLDGMAEDGSIIEIKCPSMSTHALAQKGIVPHHYLYQLYHQMVVCGAEKVTYVSYYPTMQDATKGDIVTIEVGLDKEAAEAMLEAEKAFYQLMIELTPPSMSEKDYTSRDDEEWNTLLEEYRSLDNIVKKLQERKEAVRDKIIHICEGKNSQGNGMKVFRSFCKGTIDYKNIDALRDLDLESFRKPPIEKWTIRVT